MLVLVATNDLQGTTEGDYTRTVEGELVTPLAAECDSRGHCGCNRGFPGLASGHATTTAMIVDRPGVTEADLRDAVYDWLDRCGWLDLFEQAARDDHSTTADGYGPAIDVDVEEMVDAIIDEHVDTIHDVCATYPVGTVVNRRGHLLSARSQPSAA